MEFSIRTDKFVVPPISAMSSFALQPVVAPFAGRLLNLISALLRKRDGTPLTLEDLREFATMGADDGVAALMTQAPGLLPQLGDLIGCIRPVDLEHLTRKLLSGGKLPSTINGMPLFSQGDEPFETIFQHRTRDLWIVLAYALWENYPDFFPKFAANGESAAKGSGSETSST